MPEPIALAGELVGLDTGNPPGNESRAARVIAAHLDAAGVDSQLVELEAGRESLLARLPGSDDSAPALCFVGHLDTVPIGTEAWSHEPLGGEVDGDRLWGRGASDMKGGCAAMVAALAKLADRPRRCPLTLVLCAAEETGAEAAAAVASRLGAVGALIVGEPTGGRVAVAHAGVAWIRLVSEGRAAHASDPGHGENAIVKMARALAALGALDLAEFGEEHPAVGRPSLSVGTISGGVAPNVVPARCEAMVDLRIVPGNDPAAAEAMVRTAVASYATVNVETCLPAIETPHTDEWLRSVFAAAAQDGAPEESIGMRYFTDASILAPALGFPPVAIVGPGEPALAHRADEWCSVTKIRDAACLYEKLGAEWDDRAPAVSPTAKRGGSRRWR